MQADMISPFIKRRHKREKVSYIHPRLAKVLRETYGVLIFQEQVLRIVHELTGLGYDWADDFRRSMTKDRGKEEMEKLKEQFIGACIKNGVSEDVAQEAWRQVSSFAAYGFCKAHAASFAYITYQSAYLKAHYPLEFYIGLLNAGQVGTYPARVILNEARRRFPVYGPHVNHSTDRYIREGAGIGVPLSVIKGIGDKFIKRIVSERETNGPYRSVEDFKARVKIPKNAFFAPVNSDALEGLDHETRYTSVCAERRGTP
jgi:DNA polymerase III alpha subunit